MNAAANQAQRIFLQEFTTFYNRLPDKIKERDYVLSDPKDFSQFRNEVLQKAIPILTDCFYLKHFNTFLTNLYKRLKTIKITDDDDVENQEEGFIKEEIPRLVDRMNAILAQRPKSIGKNRVQNSNGRNAAYINFLNTDPFKAKQYIKFHEANPKPSYKQITESTILTWDDTNKKFTYKQNGRD